MALRAWFDYNRVRGENMSEALKQIYWAIKLGEKLKYELRHSWLSNGRQESVAEHTWRLSLMAMLIEPYLEENIDSEKLLKMIIIHDLVEAEASDIPAFDTLNNPKLLKQKHEKEREAIDHIKQMLPEPLGSNVFDLWIEFENKHTYEAKVANALDKLEAQIQHNEADIVTWKPIEYKMSFMLDQHTNFSPILSQFKELIEQEAEEKINKANHLSP